MAIQPEPAISRSFLRPGATVPVKTAAILPSRHSVPDANPLVDETTDGRLGPARGLNLGLLLGIGGWLAIGLAAWIVLL